MTERSHRRQRADGARSRQTILRAAANLATIDGLEGLSIGNLAAHIGMSKSGLYAHFGSKEELQLATVETARGILDDEVLSKVAHIEDPLEQLKALCTAFVDYVERRVFQGGCFFAAVEAEFDTHPGPVKEAIVASQQEWADLLERLLAEAKRVGEIAADEDPAQLGFELNAYLLMGNTMFVLHDDASYLRRAQAAILRRLDEAA